MIPGSATVHPENGAHSPARPIIPFFALRPPILTQRGRTSLCYGLVLFAASLVFIQFLFEGAMTYSTPVINDENTPSDVLDESTHKILRRGMVRFPRTRRRLPDCLIIGARKCGTRALLEFLNLHPRVVKAAEEIHFFDDDERYSLGLEWYRRRMPYSFPHQVTIEKSPAYFITPAAPSRIYHMNPSVRLLLIVRDPVTRLISDYAQLASNKARKDRTLASFEDLVIRTDGTVNVDYKAVRIGIYSSFFPRWLRTFPREQIHVVDGDRLVLDPFQEIQKIEDFLDIGHRITEENFYYNETKGFFCVRNATADKCLNDSKGRKHPVVPTEVIRTLRKFYESHSEEFFKQANVTFDWASE